MRIDGEGRRAAAARPAAELSFRAATSEDIPALVELVNSAYRGDNSRQGWTTEADLLGGQRVDSESIAEIVARPATTVLLAEADGRLAACCELERTNAGDAYFGMFSVLPAAQGNGLGKRLLAEAERIAAQEWGCRRLRMTVIRQRDDLIAWYERRGYRRTGGFHPFPYGDERYGIPKRPDLEFADLAKPLRPDGDPEGLTSS